jgi:site-specific recombinase XerD
VARLLFGNRDGRPLRRNVLGDTWARAARRAELPADARGWHCLRHGYASALLDAGVSVRALQARLGHANASETLDIYSHLMPDSDDDTRRAVEAAYGA